MNNPEIRHEQVLNNPELQPPVGIDQVTPEQQASLTQEHSLMDRVRESKLLVGATALLATGAMVIGITDKAYAAKKKYTNNYQDHEVAPLDRTKDANIIKECIDLNVAYRSGDKDDSVKFQYPYGSIESQRISAKVGRKSVSVVTKLRDTNVDTDMDRVVKDRRDAKMEFLYGCSYLTNSNTTLNLRTRKSRAPISAEKIISYRENPRIFHQKRFVAKTFKTKLNLPKKLTKRDLKKGTYCVSSKQFSEPTARPFDLNAVEISSPGQGSKLLDPTQNVGMIAQDLQDGTNTGIMPTAKSKTYKKCITKTKQYTLKPPKDSPWTHYPY